jgi:hypothetical protein
MRFFKLSFVALALIGATPAAAQAVVTPAPVTIATPDAERMALASRLAGKILPDGIYKKMFSGVFDQMGNGMMNQMMDLPLRDFAAMAGEDGEALKAKMGPGTLKQVMAIIDPNFNERMGAMFKAMEPEFSKLFTKFEPPMREGLSVAYANRFSATQLKELDIFFATPTGSAYASQSMTIFMDPAVMEKMMGVMPEMMKSMPELMKPAMAAMEKFPKIRTAKDLTKAERAQLAELMGIPESKLK